MTWRRALSLSLLLRCAPPDPASCATLRSPSLHWTTFHGSPGRSGWNDQETTLTPALVASPRFGLLWRSEPFAPVTVEGRAFAPHAFASPLYVDDLLLTRPPWAGRRFAVVFAATSSGDIYALNAFDDRCGARAGTVLWRRRLSDPGVAPDLEGGLPVGVLSTPVIDRAANPPRLYAASMDARAGWQVFALDLATGDPLAGWPVTLSAEAVEAVNRNGPARWRDPRGMSQRGALNLSPDGSRLYVAFGSYRAASVGWMLAIDTRAPRVAASFSSAPDSEARSNGGMWGSGGPAVDAQGRVHMTTGNGPREHMGAPSHWSSSLLQWDETLALRGAYTPFDYCVLDERNMDLSGSSPTVLPDETLGRSLMVFGGKQGLAYLVDRARLSTGLQGRGLCRDTPEGDASLFASTPQAMWNRPGPLSVFGPYTTTDAQLDTARMRTTPSYFVSESRGLQVFLSGSPKRAEGDPTSVAPGLVRLALLSGGAPSLAIDARSMELVLQNPGSPLVTSDRGSAPIVWVLDSMQPRTRSLVGPDARPPVLYAVDGTSMRLLWRSGERELTVGGKYNEALVAHGTVFVATDRLYAFGLSAQGR